MENVVLQKRRGKEKRPRTKQIKALLRLYNIMRVQANVISNQHCPPAQAKTKKHKSKGVQDFNPDLFVCEGTNLQICVN